MSERMTLTLLVNLQSLVEKIGSECGGKVWVVCTGQEAIDEIIKAPCDEFSQYSGPFQDQTFADFFFRRRSYPETYFEEKA